MQNGRIQHGGTSTPPDQPIQTTRCLLVDAGLVRGRVLEANGDHLDVLGSALVGNDSVDNTEAGLAFRARARREVEPQRLVAFFEIELAAVREIATVSPREGLTQLRISAQADEPCERHLLYALVRKLPKVGVDLRAQLDWDQRGSKSAGS